MSDQIQLIPEEAKLIELMRETKFGELTIKLRGGKPVLVEKGIQTIKLEA